MPIGVGVSKYTGKKKTHSGKGSASLCTAVAFCRRKSIYVAHDFFSCTTQCSKHCHNDVQFSVMILSACCLWWSDC